MSVLPAAPVIVANGAWCRGRRGGRGARHRPRALGSVPRVGGRPTVWGPGRSARFTRIRADHGGGTGRVGFGAGSGWFPGGRDRPSSPEAGRGPVLGSRVGGITGRTGHGPPRRAAHRRTAAAGAHGFLGPGTARGSPQPVVALALAAQPLSHLPAVAGARSGGLRLVGIGDRHDTVGRERGVAGCGLRGAGALGDRGPGAVRGGGPVVPAAGRARPHAVAEGGASGVHTEDDSPLPGPGRTDLRGAGGAGSGTR